MKTQLLLFLIVSLLLSLSSGEQCGRQAKGALCPNDLCCSKYGWCGSTEDYCKHDCQSQCIPGPPGNLSDIISRSQFDDMLKNRNYEGCPARGFYTYEAFITAAKFFPGFGTTGDTATRKKEIAAFFGQTSQQTTRGSPGGPYVWGYCHKDDILDRDNPHCLTSTTWPCAPGKYYYGRGPMQLSWNYNYGPCGIAIGIDLLNNPDLVSKDSVITFKTAIWFWMTPQSPKPSCHDVITDQWQPSDTDIAAGRVPGYGVITNIINGGYECGHGQDTRVENRIGFYQRYCQILGAEPGDNIDCYNQTPFGRVKSFLDAVI